MIYDNLSPFLDRSPFLRQFDENIVSDKKGSLFYQLNTTTKSLLIVRIKDLIAKNGLLSHILFVTTDDGKAEEYLEDLYLLAGRENVVYIPDFETLAYEERSPHFSIRAKRIEGLSRLLGGKPQIVVTSVKNVLRKIVPPKYLKENIIRIKRGSDYDIQLLCSKLVSNGYKNETEVTQVGDFARRGGIIDIFSPSYRHPVRLEFFGDEIDSCRFFDLFTQRSTGEMIDEVTILPVREVFLDEINSIDEKHWEKIHNEGLYEGIEQDVSLLYKETAVLYDYLPADKTVTVIDDFPYLKSIAEEVFQETENLFQRKSEKRTKQSLPLPEELFMRIEEFMGILSAHKHLYLSGADFPGEAWDNDTAFMTPFTSQTGMNGDLNLLRKILDRKLEEKWDIIIQSDNKSQSRRMQELLVEYSERVTFSLGVLHCGFNLEDAKFSVFTDHEIFNRYKQKKFQEYFPTSEALIDYETLHPGDFIVHIDHGIGLYEGLKTMVINGVKIECLSIRYADNARVYVPTFQLQLVSRYVAEEGIKPEIHKLGSKRWESLKSRAKKQIELIADDIVKLYAERSSRAGISFDSDTVWQSDLEDSFIYEDTPDQRMATEEIKQDMEALKPMERLLCGDVGFGKTEVAIRAAFKAVASGWQAAVIVPTTLLAEQHYNVFRERLAQYPVNITMFSRFRTSGALKKDVEKLKRGEIDIAVGTHRLFSKDVAFKKLGLLIIDEEHRFGVRHKETLRKMKANVDTLYMSATPIPRTMSMALAKFKEMSLMQTSPKARLPIRTVIISYDREVIKDAVLREMERGGQVFFLHNRVETIDTIADELREMLPKARIAVGHGKLPERALERVMLDFYDKKYDVLVATTIIESGIDIPNANTIIINRSDMFGLAQLYQLRGRVGRSDRRAYAYFIIPKHLKEQARKRLEALTEYNALGSGYQIAMRDLELRGAGTMMGTKQSGVIQTIGFNYYNRLLSEAVKSLTTERTDHLPSAQEHRLFSDIETVSSSKKPEEMTTAKKRIIWQDEQERQKEKLQIDADFFFPVNYIESEKTRLEIYKRMLNFTSVEEFRELELELRDRFGEIPNPARRGIKYYRLRLLSNKANLESFSIRNRKITIEFSTQPSYKKLHDFMAGMNYPMDFNATGKRLLLTISLEKEKDKTGKRAEDSEAAKDEALAIAERVLYNLL